MSELGIVIILLIIYFVYVIIYSIVYAVRQKRLLNSMEQRYAMEFFLLDVDDNQGVPVKKRFYMKHKRKVLYGMEIIEQNSKFTFYILPKSRNKALLFIYLGDNTFDSIVGDSFIRFLFRRRRLRRNCPVFMDALDNGIIGQYSRPALSRMTHICDNGYYYWCLATNIENVDYANPYSGYVGQIINRLVGVGTNIMGEIERYQSVERSLRDFVKAWRVGRFAYRVGEVLLMAFAG